MSRTKALYLIAAATLIGGQAYAQTATSQIPPQNSKKLSQLVASVEQRDKFQYVKDIEWDDDGYYQITYYTSDKAKVEIKLDPVSGQPR
ncbi:MAG: PepSY domain-containing protein [Hyphomicrobiales bacterium]|nr:PepSY domain-containing protein [Hyphomicrobiales bacterium]